MSGLALAAVSVFCFCRASAELREVVGHEVNWKVPKEPVLALTHQNGDACVEHLEASPSGDWVVTAHDDAFCIWRAPTCFVNATSASCIPEAEPWQCLKQPGPVKGLEVMNPFTIALIEGKDVLVWTINASAPTATLSHNSTVELMDSEGEWLATGTQDGFIHMWWAPFGFEEFANPKWSYNMKKWAGGRGFDITALALCKGNRWMGVSTFRDYSDTSKLILWDVRGKSPDTPTRIYSQISRILAVEFAPTQTWLVAGSEAGAITSWRHVEHEEVPLRRRFVFWAVRYLRFSPCGSWLLAGNYEGSADLWDVAGYFVDAQSPATSFELLGGGRIAMSADTGLVMVAEGGNCRVSAWPLDLRDSQWSFEFADNEREMRDLLLSPSGKHVLSGQVGHPARLSLWAVQRRANVPLLSMQIDDRLCCMLTLGEDEVIVGLKGSRRHPDTNPGRVGLWHITWNTPGPMVATEKALFSVPGCYLISLAIYFDPDFWICGCRSKVVILQRRSAQFASVLRVLALETEQARATAVAAVGNGFAVGTSAGSVCLYPLRQKEAWNLSHSDGIRDEEDIPRCVYPGSEINDLQLQSANGTELYSGGSNGRTCRIFLKTLTMSCFDQPGNEPREVLDIEYMLEKNLLISSSANGIIALWYLDVDIFQQQPSPLTWYETENYHMHLAASPDATYIYVSGTLGEIQARFIESVSAAVRRMLQSPLCQMKDVCNTDSVTYHGKDPIELPHYLESLPLQWLGLQDAKIRVMSPEPPISMRAVNLSGAGLSDWQSMSTGWFSIPSIIDISATPAYVSVPILHGQAVRLVTDQNCVDAASQKEKGLNFCILRSAQKEDQLCATHFESHDMTREALAAKVTGSPLPVKTVILVDQEDFIAWLCDCPAGRFGTNGSHCEICPLNHYCPAAGNGTRALNFRASPCPPGAGTTGIGLTSIKQCECLPGFYTVKSTTDPGGFLCRSCPPGASSFSYGMMECQACQFGYRSYDWPRLQPSNFCFPDWFGLGFMIAMQLAMIQLVYSTWRHFQGLAISEVKVQHGKWVVSTMGRRELWIFPCLETFQVSFRKTGNPWLDDPQKPYRVRAIRGSDLRLVLLQGGEEMKAESSWPGLFGEDDDYDSSEVSEEGQAVWTSRIRLDTSQGFIRLSCPFACLCGRILPAVVICPLLFLASGILLKLAVYRKIWIMLGLPFTTVIALLVVAGAYFSAPAPAMHNNVLNFRHLLPPPKLVPRGGARAVKVESIEHLLNHFRFSIGDRDMYYVNSNILLPVTKPTQLSFAELAGPVQTKYFVSHYWGIPFENSMQSIMKHSWTTEREKWQSAAYWCCSFSNNQWSIAEELGNGDIAQSSFYLALTDPRTCATVMVLDEKAQALKRVWCLFEVLQTCILSQKKPGFEGLFLCTPSGVLNKESAQSDGSLSIDTAIAVARSLRHLKLEEASATNPADKVMIDELVERYPGKHEAMNRFVRRHIRDALNLIREHHNQTFAWLLRELERSERSESGPLAPGMSRAPPIFPTMPVTSVSLSSLPSGSSRGHMSQKSLSSVCPSGHLLEPNGEDSSGSSSESEHFVAPRPK